MRKKILVRLTLIMGLLIICLQVFFSTYLRNTEFHAEIKNLEVIVKQSIQNYQMLEKYQKQARNLFAKDYFKRVQIAQIITNEKNLAQLNTNQWQETLNFLGIQIINILNEHAVVVQSSQPQNIGLKLLQIGELRQLMNNAAKKYILDLNGKDPVTKQKTIYLVCKLSATTSMQLQIPYSEWQSYQRQATLKQLTKAIPTQASRTLFVLNENNKLLALSWNNTQKVNIDNRLKQVKKATKNPIIVEFNQKKVLMVAKKYADKYFVYTSQLNKIEQKILGQLGNVIFFMLILLLVALLVVYFMMDRLVLKDIESLNFLTKRFCQGYNVKFSNYHTPELNGLAQNLSKLINVIGTKNEHLSSVVSLLGDNFGAYEYYRELNQLYYSKNLPNLLGISEEECVVKLKEQLKKEGQRLNELPDENAKIENSSIFKTVDGKTLLGHHTYSKQISYTFFEDVTEEQNIKENLKATLQKAQNENYLDSLTKLYNRKMLIKKLTNIIKQKDPQGIILFMDMDNFKEINDQFGHLQGDILLKEFADILRAQFGNDAVKVRLGGDEFVVVLTHAIEKQLLEKKLTNFLKVVNEKLFAKYHNVNLTVSIGAAYIIPQFDDIDSLYQKADEAMYYAKKHGKNNFYII